MRKLILSLFVSSLFAGFGVGTLSASVIKDGIVLASNDKCGSEAKYNSPKKCGDEEMLKKHKNSKCGEGKKEYEKRSSKCGSEKRCGSEKPKRAISGSCGDGKCGS